MSAAIDSEIMELADRLAAIKRTSARVAIIEALHNEIERSAPQPAGSTLQRVIALQNKLDAMRGPDAQPVDKAWIDSLYE